MVVVVCICSFQRLWRWCVLDTVAVVSHQVRSVAGQVESLLAMGSYMCYLSRKSLPIQDRPAVCMVSHVEIL
jgi:NAD kinase